MKPLFIYSLLCISACAQSTAVFPPGVVTPAQLGVSANQAASSLTLPVSTTDTTLNVYSSSPFKVGSYVTVDSEIMAVCAIPDGTHLTVGVSTCPNLDGRGTDTANGGGAVATHIPSAPVQARIVAKQINQLDAEVIALENQALGNIPSLHGLGCVGNGVTDDTACVQAQIYMYTALKVDRLFCVDSLYFPSPIQLIGISPTAGFIRCSNLASATAILNVTGAHVTFQNFVMNGATTSPTQISYDSGLDPLNNLLTANTSIWVFGGATDFIADGIQFTHTGGYAGIIDARMGNISRVAIVNCVDSDARATVFGVPGDYNYGGYTGGFLWSNNGTSYTIDDLLFQRDKFYRLSGHGIWGHSTAIALQNTGLRILNCYFEDMGLDAMQVQNFRGGLVADNFGRRIGYLSLTDGAPGVPRWLPASESPDLFSIPAVFLDTSALVVGVDYVNNSADAINGEFMDGDGYGSGTVRPGTGTSCWFSTDPYAQISLCGPGQDGINYAVGWNSGNSSGSAFADVNVDIEGGRWRGFGGGAIKIYGCSGCKVHGAAIEHPNSGTGLMSPIDYGPFIVSSTTYRATNNEISGNTAYWSPSTGAIVAEDSTYAAFLSTDYNLVHDNQCIGTSGPACTQLAKAPVSTATTGPVIEASVTPGACAYPTAVPPNCVIETHRQTEGTTAATFAHKVYADIGGAGQLLMSCILNPLSCYTVGGFNNQYQILPFTVTNGAGVSGNLATAGPGNTLTFAACPWGVAGTDVAHNLYLSGGVGTAEVVTVTGGTCTSGNLAGGTITTTTANVHTGAWSVSSSGLQEVVNTLPNGGVIVLPPVTTNLNGETITSGPQHQFVGRGMGLTGVTQTGPNVAFYVTTASVPVADQYDVIAGARFSDFTLTAQNGIQFNAPLPASPSTMAGNLVQGPMVSHINFQGTYGSASDPNRLTNTVPSLSELRSFGVCLSFAQSFDGEIANNLFSGCGIAVYLNSSDIAVIRQNRFASNARNIEHDVMSGVGIGNSLKITHNDIIGIQRVGGIYLNGAGFTDIESNFFENIQSWTGSPTIGVYIASSGGLYQNVHDNRFDSPGSTTGYPLSFDDYYGDQITHNLWNPHEVFGAATVPLFGHTFWSSASANQYLFADNSFNWGTANAPANAPVYPGVVLEKLNPLRFAAANIPGNALYGACSSTWPFVQSSVTGRWVLGCSSTSLIFQFSLPTAEYTTYQLLMTAREIGSGVTPVGVTYTGNTTTSVFAQNVTYTNAFESQTVAGIVSVPFGETLNGHFTVTIGGGNAEWESIELAPVSVPGVSVLASATTLAFPALEPANAIVQVTGTTGVTAISGLATVETFVLVAATGSITFTAGSTIGNTITMTQGIPHTAYWDGAHLWIH